MKKLLAAASVLGSMLFGGGLALAGEGDNPDRSTLDENILFVVDKSGSMYNRLPAIKTAVTEIVGTLKPEHNAGLIAFDGCGEDRIKYLVPLSRRSGRRIAATVGTLQSEGSTALAVALDKVAAIMQDKKVCPRVIIFTDNDDTCNGSPQAIKDRFNADREKFCLQLDVISATTDKDTLRNLQDLANGLGGNLWQAETSEDIIAAIRRIVARQRAGNGNVRGTDQPNQGGNTGTGDTGDDDDGAKERERARAGADAEKGNQGNGSGGGSH